MQPDLFGSLAEPWEEDDRRSALVASVVFATGPEKTYDYLVPERLVGAVEPGRRIRAPLGRGDKPRLGYCVAVEMKQSERRLKELIEVVDSRPLLSPAMLKLTAWMADHYLCGWGEVMQSVLPAAVRDGAGMRRVTYLTPVADVAQRLPKLKLPPKQIAVMNTLVAAARPMTPVELAEAAGCTPAPITALRSKGLILAETSLQLVGGTVEQPHPQSADLELHEEQQTALDMILSALEQRRHETLLIHGVTGSGKTEVYIRAIQEVVRYGKQAIVLVPEISLTPQTRERFRARFPSVAVLHSHQSDVERHAHWDRIARGEVQVVVGARSAVFAPVPRLGLLILDEEHESSFKQDSQPRYHAREVALRRAAIEGVPLVLASATPSLESYQRAKNGEFRLLDMPNRVLGLPMPPVVAVDLRNEFRARRSRGAIGRQLHQAIASAIADGGQVILLLNRRGFATHIQCPGCGYVAECPNCDLPLTHHRQQELAVCHYCDHQIEAPTQCPECGFGGIRYWGLGTERLEAEVRARFPQATCLRMDTDSMRRPGSHAHALEQFKAGKVQILLGTQMIAKGLDFPNVTVVGVVNADTALHLPDFRAAERTFQLVTQVAGRTGRGERGGRVLVQTFSPDHPAIRCAVLHDYERFAAGELPAREELAYPPFASLIRIIARGPRLEVVQEFANLIRQRLAEIFAERGIEVRLLGPAPAPIAKLRGQHRFHMLLNSHDAEGMRAAVRTLQAELPVPEDTQWLPDVDPLEMM